MKSRADVGFSREGGGGGGFSKSDENFDDFFRPTKLIFLAFPNHYKDPHFNQIFRAAVIIRKKTGQKTRFYALLSFFNQQIVLCFARAPNPKLVYLGALKKVFLSVSRNWGPNKTTKGGTPKSSLPTPKFTPD